MRFQMFSPKVKKFLSGIMIAGDLLLGSFFLADLLTGYDTEIDLFILFFLAADALLSVDYIGKLTKEQVDTKKKEQQALRRQAKKQEAAAQAKDLDRQMAADIASNNEALMQLEEEAQLDPDELREMLSAKNDLAQTQQKGN